MLPEQMNQNLSLGCSWPSVGPIDNMMKNYLPFGKDYQNFDDNQNSDFINITKNDVKDQKEKQRENTDSSPDEKINLIDVGGDEDIMSFKKNIQCKNFNKLSDKEMTLLLEDISKQISAIQMKANDPNSLYTKSYFEQEIKYLLIKAKELERLQKSFNHNNVLSQRIFDSSGDKLDITKINNFRGNKERQNSWKYTGYQDNILETTGFTSKNHVLLKEEVIQKRKQLEFNSQVEFKNYIEELFIETIKSSIDSITILINERAKLKYGYDLNYIYIAKIYELDINNYVEYLDSTIIDIYLGKFLKINHEEKHKIKIWINSLLYKEKVNKDEKIKLLNMLFLKKVEDILLLYINDDPYIQVENKNNANFYLKKFKTFKDDFNQYNINEKELIKDHFLYLLNIKLSNIFYEESNEQNQNEELPKETIEKKDKRRKEQTIPKNQDKVRRGLMVKGLQSFHSTLKNILAKFVKRKPHKVTVIPQIGKSPSSYYNFCKKSMFDLYKDSRPRRLNKECRKDKSKYTYNIDLINEAIEKEKILEKEDDRILGKIFKKDVIVKDILEVFLEAKKDIKIKGEKPFHIKELITYKEFYNDKYDKKRKEFNRIDLIGIINGWFNNRKISIERNRKLRGNPNLGRKKKRIHKYFKYKINKN